MPEPTPDYFDRLLARHTGVTVSARPRLPGPFERAEPRWQEVEAPPSPPVARPAVREPGERPLPAPVHTERHTEIHIERAEPSPADPSPSPRIAHARPAEPAAVRFETQREIVTEDPPVRPAAAPPPSSAPTAVRADLTVAGPAPLPRAAAARVAPSPATRREAGRTADPRRRERPAAEPAVHVRIGRLEVRATAPAKAPTPRTGRPAPAVSLTGYLTGEGRS